MPHLQNILVPIDFSATSQKALRFACGLAQQYNAKLTLFFVYHAPTNFFPEEFSPTVGSLFEDLFAYYEKTLSSTVKSLEGQVSIAPNMKLAQGIPDVEIVREAEAGDYDLIIMGSHGRSGLSRTLLGSVAEKVLRHTNIPTLIVPQRSE
jgi:universal stress protein A